jgi:prepilin-type N-terminal cleavage/methylation domain-containing protein
MKYKIIQGERGFTLIEIAIVMVIIGILMGAMVQGQQMIKNAKDKDFQQKIRFIAAAQFTYLDRMSRYAGDTTVPADGIIDNNVTAFTELQGQQILQNNAQIHVFNGTFSYGGGVAPYANNNHIWATNVPMWVVQSLDNKIDDGAGDTGNVRWRTPAGVAYPAVPPADPNNVDNLCTGGSNDESHTGL